MTDTLIQTVWVQAAAQKRAELQAIQAQERAVAREIERAEAQEREEANAKAAAEALQKRLDHEAEEYAAMIAKLEADKKAAAGAAGAGAGAADGKGKRKKKKAQRMSAQEEDECAPASRVSGRTQYHKYTVLDALVGGTLTNPPSTVPPGSRLAIFLGTVT